MPTNRSAKNRYTDPAESGSLLDDGRWRQRRVCKDVPRDILAYYRETSRIPSARSRISFAGAAKHKASRSDKVQWYAASGALKMRCSI